jgi:predicted TIM-barrel fold metal-dependent hydrolase
MQTIFLLMKRFFLLLTAFSLILTGCNSYYTLEDYASVKKIDAHVHIRSSDGIFENIASSDNFILISPNVDHGDSSDLRVQQDFASASAKKYPGRVFFEPSFYFDTTGWGTESWSIKIIQQLEKDLSVPGAIGVKIWKNIGMVLRNRDGRFIMIDNQGLDPVINYIKSRGLPVTGHLGEPINCWMPLEEMNIRSNRNYYEQHPEYHMYMHPEYPSYDDQIIALDNFVAKHPDMIFIGCHLGSLEWNVDSLAERFDRFPNMAVDISARIAHLQFQSMEDKERVRNFCIKYQDRLLYGTDVGYSGSNNPDGFEKRMHDTWLDDWKYLVTDLEMTSTKFDGKFTGLKLPKEVIDKIYFKNAVKWYKLKI